MRAFAYTLVTTAIVLGFALAEWWAERYVSDRSRLAGVTVEALLVVVAALVFQPIHHHVDALVVRAFTYRKRRALAALAQFRRELSSFSDQVQLLRRVIEAVQHYLDARGCAVYLRRDAFKPEASSFDSALDDVALDDPLSIRFRSTGTPARPALLKSSACGTHAFPMTVAGDLVGFFCIECIRREYEADELQMLSELTQELAVALVALDPLLRLPDGSSSLPAVSEAATLIGRDAELRDVDALLKESRLVTLTGAGGVGKTRLALQVAASVRERGESVWFVDLTPLAEGALVPASIAAAFGIADDGQRPPIQRVASFLRERASLLVLDNCEHVLDAACVAVTYLLQHCPHLRVLATSREPLALSNEEPYRVPSLPAPAPDEALTAERALEFSAVSLFVVRARTVDRSFTLTDDTAECVADIVRRVDGIPMAIELAAARTRVLSVKQIAHRLDERFSLLSAGSRAGIPRHQTLEALIGWSYDLLHDNERRVLERVSTFRGDWTLEAAEAVCRDSERDDWEVIDLLEALVDKSLVVTTVSGDERRYRLLESTRQFAAQRLIKRPDAVDAHDRHSRYFALLGRRLGDAYWETDSDEWASRVRADLENVRAAIGWQKAHDREVAAALISELRWFWYAMARREGHACVVELDARHHEYSPRTRAMLALTAALLDQTALAATAAAEALRDMPGANDAGYAEALAFEGIALGRAGQLSEVRARFDLALERARATGLPRLIGWVLSMMAYWRGAAGEAQEAASLFEEAAAALRFCNDPWQLARLHVHRAEFYFAQGQHVLALSSVREAESVFRSRQSATGLTISLLNACAYELALGRIEEAWEHAREGLHLARQLDNDMACAWAIGHLAEIAAEAGDAPCAARLLGAADAVYQRTGGQREPTEQRGYDRALQFAIEKLGAERAAVVMRDGAQLDVHLAAEEALTVPRPSVAAHA